MEVAAVMEPVASPEHVLKVVPSMRKVLEAIHPVCLFRNTGFQEILDEHELMFSDSFLN